MNKKIDLTNVSDEELRVLLQDMWDKDELCSCHCHIKGMMVMHMVPCCSYTLEKYINQDDTFDVENMIKIVRKYEKQ